MEGFPLDWVAEGAAMKTDQLDPDVFLFRGEKYDSGSLVLLNGDKALLVEGMGSVEDALRLRETLVSDWGKRVAILISTHFFSDHMAAWNLFPEAILIAHQNAIQTFWTEEFRTAEEAAHFRKPTMALSGRLELDWGRFRLDLFESPGHTADALHVDIPEADLLHVGDAAVGRIAYLHYSAPEPIDRALARALTHGRRRVLRSHGPVAGIEVLQLAREYLRRLRERVVEARRAGEPIAGIPIAACMTPGEHATKFEAFFHARNLASIEERGLFVEAA
jgi:glyoxylase-like metal-dependent hydrolase (beta-lactamase superfamily II)